MKHLLVSDERIQDLIRVLKYYQKELGLTDRMQYMLWDLEEMQKEGK